MPSVHSINQTNTTKPFLTAENTGVLALGGMCLTTASALSKAKPFRKHHKHLAYITGALTLLHLGTAIHNNLNKNKSTEFIA